MSVVVFRNYRPWRLYARRRKLLCMVFVLPKRYLGDESTGYKIQNTPTPLESTLDYAHELKMIETAEG